MAEFKEYMVIKRFNPLIYLFFFVFLTVIVWDIVLMEMVSKLEGNLINILNFNIIF
jgi:hypothetical protein